MLKALGFPMMQKTLPVILIIINLVYAPFLFLLVWGGMPRWYAQMYGVGVIILGCLFVAGYKLKLKNRGILLLCCMLAMLLTHTKSGLVFGVVIPSVTIVYALLVSLAPSRYPYLFWFACGTVGSYIWLQSANNFCNYLVLYMYSFFSTETDQVLSFIRPIDLELIALSLVVVGPQIVSIVVLRFLQTRGLTNKASRTPQAAPLL